MVAEIKGTGPQNVSAVDTGLRKVGGPSAVAPTEPTKTSEVVTLTDLAARLQHLTDSVAQLPEVDKVRVAELKTAIRTAWLQAHTKDEAAFKRLSDGKAKPYEAVDNAAYDDTIKLIQFVDQLRRRSS